MEIIPVSLGERSYNIHIGEGLLQRCGSIISEVCSGKKAAVITNPTIGRLYSGVLMESLEKAGVSADTISIPAGERYKTLKTVARIYESLADYRIDRGDLLISLGGGIVGDITGFVAATWLRGVDFIQIPTSLLAQVDASVGGKTGVNITRGKNLVGAFHQPKAVIIDTSVLDTLPKREFRCGLAEVIKHGIIRDRDYFEYVEQNLSSIMSLNRLMLEDIIAESCHIKADIVSRDEHESGLRRILNFGHTTGHAIERITGYKKYKHGEAVSIGMVSAVLLVDEVIGVEPGMIDRVTNLLRAVGLPTKFDLDIDPQKIISAMRLDKKVVHGKLSVVLSKEIGSAYIDDSITDEGWISAFKRQLMLND